MAQELHRLTQTPVKLSAKGCLRMALDIAQTDEKALEELAEVLEASPDTFPHVCQFLRNCMRWVREPTFTMPTRDMRRYTWLAGRHFDRVVAEAGALNSSVFELVALAIWKVAQEHPECFGTVDDYEEHQKRIRHLEQRLEQLYRQIEDSFTREDLCYVGPLRDGYVKVGFKVTEAQVPLAPGFGQRLVEWVLQHPETVEY